MLIDPIFFATPTHCLYPKVLKNESINVVTCLVVAKNKENRENTNNRDNRNNMENRENRENRKKKVRLKRVPN